ncbi:M48 family metallopeptidase [Corynebacterium caspium]|uniref:M48 metallopeptidase family protein n=1 Tax=Corynebacterium caspium TaxID=234828 RepID=UPI000369B00F|nr:YgjP-like metallopeptidase domain-containing protein [Corynebacterium caspium]WKD59686.1 hypothetical protein CCASP_06535 [Corynebacterium caspium DSM 44850]
MEPNIKIIRSARRRHTSQAKLIGANTIEVRIPDSFTKSQEEKTVSSLLAKIDKRRGRVPRSDQELTERAAFLNDKYLESRAVFRSIRWVSNQTSKWGSCTVLTGDIRISDRLNIVPTYVLDAVLIHELVHTFIAGGHTEEFWDWADRAPHAEKAKGYLEAYSHFGPERSS